MTVAVRVIPCLDVDAGRVVKGVNFVDLRDAGDPVELAAAYDAAGADELTFLDVTASSDERGTMLDVVHGAHAATDGQRDEHLLGGAGDHVVGGGPAVARGGHVEERELVRPLGVVAGSQLDRVAGITQVDEVDPLDHPTGVDVETGDHAYGQAHGGQPNRPAAEPGKPV